MKNTVWPYTIVSAAKCDTNLRWLIIQTILWQRKMKKEEDPVVIIIIIITLSCFSLHNELTAIFLYFFNYSYYSPAL